MNTEINTPYVKHRDENGNVTNPITDKYVSEGKNRKQRREIKNLKPFMGNGKNNTLTSDGSGRYNYVRIRQVARDKETGERKFIYHYLLQ